MDYPFLGEFEDYLWRTFEYRLSDIEGPSGATKRWIVNGKFVLDLEERMTAMHGDFYNPWYWCLWRWAAKNEAICGFCNHRDSSHPNDHQLCRSPILHLSYHNKFFYPPVFLLYALKNYVLAKVELVISYYWQRGVGFIYQLTLFISHPLYLESFYDSRPISEHISSRLLKKLNSPSNFALRL